VNLKELLAVHHRLDKLEAAMAALLATLAEDAPKARGGGDPRSAARAVRDAALRDLAGLLKGKLSLAEQAREIHREVIRYRPAVGDESGKLERRALHRIAASKLGVPGQKQLKRIIGNASGDQAG
jgi:hypothetical protein